MRCWEIRKGTESGPTRIIVGRAISMGGEERRLVVVRR